MSKIIDFIENLKQEKEKYSQSTIDFHYGGVDALQTVQNVMKNSTCFFDFSYIPGKEVYILDIKKKSYEQRKVVSIQIIEYGGPIIEFNEEIKINDRVSTSFDIDEIEDCIFLEKPFLDFYDSYEFLENCDYFNDARGINRLNQCIDIFVVKVNPSTLEKDTNNELNTLVQVWLEAGRYDKECRHHDYRLDCGGDTYEDAIIMLANLVKKIDC